MSVITEKHAVFSCDFVREYMAASRHCTWYNHADFCTFVVAIYDTPQGGVVPIPKWMTSYTANEFTSVIRVHRETIERMGGEVDIKKVAEKRGSRYNNGKARFDLLDPIAQHGLVAVLGFGATKYAAHNWRKGLPYMEIIASMQRHIMALASGQDFDEETGLHHADHIQCNAMFLSNMMKTRPDMDDRWKPEVDAS